MGDSSRSPSRASTPNPRFTSQGYSAEDLLKSQTVGLVHLSDFRKRRAEAEEAAQDGGNGSGSTTPTDGREPAAKAVFKKRRKKDVKKGGLSFGNDDEDEENGLNTAAPSRSATPAVADGSSAPPTDSEEPSDGGSGMSSLPKKRLKANTSVAFTPKAMTKSALLREAQLKESLRKEYAQMQEAVKQTDFILPFTFFDGKSMPGGACRMKKGDPIWLFLERARKVGADLAGKGDKSKKDWARIGVDDLMVVRGELIIPHHYDFHHFILNRTAGYNNQALFPYSSEPTTATPKDLLPISTPSSSDPPATLKAEDTSTLLSTAASREQAKADQIPDVELEGFTDDPNLTKVVDRRWYERHKHIFPASIWEDFDPARDYSKGARKDTEGNAFFFSR